MAVLKIADYKPQSIPIMIDATADRVRKHFRCPVCGNIVFDYYGSVRLIMHGQYDENSEMADGEEIDWFTTVGIPYPIECRGRLPVVLPNGERKKIVCKTMLFKVGL